MSGSPPRPTPRLLAAGVAAISCQRMLGMKPPPASLQETLTPTRPLAAANLAGTILPWRLRREMLKGAQGSGQLPAGQVSERKSRVPSPRRLLLHCTSASVKPPAELRHLSDPPGRHRPLATRLT
jgi:hypothetical protein